MNSTHEAAGEDKRQDLKDAFLGFFCDLNPILKQFPAQADELAEGCLRLAELWSAARQPTATEEEKRQLDEEHQRLTARSREIAEQLLAPRTPRTSYTY